ncbi:MAG: protein translocase SEC61 complex subunit gamma [Candidatus Woesearchaeota archaeon]|nr:MAG: protein translocase SEC61 complex subunit gamma [Candidatus Woesearchaeota archaeon]
MVTKKIAEYKRILRITKKPDRKEFSSTMKISALGIVVIGLIGFVFMIIKEYLAKIF